MLILYSTLITFRTACYCFQSYIFRLTVCIILPLYPATSFKVVVSLSFSTLFMNFQALHNMFSKNVSIFYKILIFSITFSIPIFTLLVIYSFLYVTISILIWFCTLTVLLFSSFTELPTSTDYYTYLVVSYPSLIRIFLLPPHTLLLRCGRFISLYHPIRFPKIFHAFAFEINVFYFQF